MEAARARQAAVVAGAVTTAFGIALTAWPETVGPRVWLTNTTGARLVGVSDLALAPGLLAGKPRWPWLAARGATNVVLAAHLAALSRGAGRPRGPLIGVALMLGLTVADSTAAAVLRADER